MMAEKVRLFESHRAEELIVSLPDPRRHMRIGRGARNFDIVIWDRVREGAVLGGTFAKFSPNPTIKHHLLSTGTKRLAEASPIGPVWDIGIRADDPEA